MKQYGNKDYVFKGYDWTEIAEYFGIDDNDENSSKAIEEKLKEIHSEMHGLSFNAHPDVRKLREFVSLCYKAEDTYKKPMWKGLSEVKEDGTFIKFMLLLYIEMWN